MCNYCNDYDLYWREMQSGEIYKRDKSEETKMRTEKCSCKMRMKRWDGKKNHPSCTYLRNVLFIKVSFSRVFQFQKCGAILNFLVPIFYHPSYSIIKLGNQHSLCVWITTTAHHLATFFSPSFIIVIMKLQIQSRGSKKLLAEFDVTEKTTVQEFKKLYAKKCK